MKILNTIAAILAILSSMGFYTSRSYLLSDIAPILPDPVAISVPVFGIVFALLSIYANGASSRKGAPASKFVKLSAVSNALFASILLFAILQSLNFDLRKAISDCTVYDFFSGEVNDASMTDFDRDSDYDEGVATFGGNIDADSCRSWFIFAFISYIMLGGLLLWHGIIGYLGLTSLGTNGKGVGGGDDEFDDDGFGDAGFDDMDF